MLNQMNAKNHGCSFLARSRSNGGRVLTRWPRANGSQCAFPFPYSSFALDLFSRIYGGRVLTLSRLDSFSFPSNVPDFDFGFRNSPKNGAIWCHSVPLGAVAGPIGSNFPKIRCALVRSGAVQCALVRSRRLSRSTLNQLRVSAIFVPLRCQNARTTPPLPRCETYKKYFSLACTSLYFHCSMDVLHLHQHRTEKLLQRCGSSIFAPLRCKHLNKKINRYSLVLFGTQKYSPVLR
jgi:hypothetical protein